MSFKVDVLVIMPHPDDAEFGAGGTIAKMTAEGKKVAYVVCTNGDKGTSDRNMIPSELIKIREEEQRQAAAVLGVGRVVFLGKPDQGLENTPELRKELVRQIRTFKPFTVITTDPYQRYMWWHRDHRQCGEAVMDAIFPYSRDHLAYPDLIAEGLEPHKVSELLLSNPQEPNYEVDISQTAILKLKSISCHKSQGGGRMDEVISALSGKSDISTYTEMYPDAEKYIRTESFHRVDMWW